jgi:hypothetical protein
VGDPQHGVGTPALDRSAEWAAHLGVARHLS